MALSSCVKLGRITSVYGIKGWVKVLSNTELRGNIFSYQPWKICVNNQWQEMIVEQWEYRGKGLIACLENCYDRKQASLYTNTDILVHKSKLPTLAKDEYYWSQLTGMQVKTDIGLSIGKVDYLIATSANDILVVRRDQPDIDNKEHLIPWLPDQVIKEVDLLRGLIYVHWDPEF